MTGTKGRKKRKKRLYFRRCHICDGITECVGHRVEHCAVCGKPMAPFYFFDDSQAPIDSDFALRPNKRTKGRMPVRGLTAYW